MGDPTDSGREPHEREWDRRERDALYAALADERCRTVLSVLDREGPMDRETLAAAVLSAERHVPVDAVPAADVAHVSHRLYHVTIPRLTEAGLVSWEDGTVRPCIDGHDAPDVRAFLEADRSRAAECLSQLGVPERRAALVVLSGTDDPVAVATLAAAMRERTDVDLRGATEDRLRVALHHVHLPALDRAGLVRYDHEARVVERAAAAPAPVDTPDETG